MLTYTLTYEKNLGKTIPQQLVGLILCLLIYLLLISISYLVSMVNMSMDVPKQKLNTIMAVLKSRRLLSDHSEILEECLTNYEDSSKMSSVSKYFNGTNCSLLITSAFVTSKFVSKRLGITLCAISSGYASGYAIMCLSKLMLYGQLWIFHNSIITLLDDIDGFDACVRRNVSYFRENALFQSAYQSSPDSVHTTSKDLITFTKSLTTIIEAIQDVVIHLETTTVPSKVDNLFQLLENLSEYLQKLCSKPTVSALKDLYNVFLYVQSHLLTRLGLLLIYNVKSHHLPKSKCKLLSSVIKVEISKDNSRYEQLTTTANNAHSNSIDHIATEPMTNLKSYSMSAASKILAIANECRRIDGIVQSVNNEHKDELMGLITNISQIENAIHICQSEYQRFVVAYYKVMNVKYDQFNSEQTLIDENEFTVNPSLNLNDFKEIQAEEEEFFTSTERTSDDESKESNRNRKCWDDELTERNIRVVKQRFRPVLAQLKGKIEPIATSLRERERNHLLSKGIDPSEFVDCNNMNEGFRSCSDSDDNEIEYVRRKKPNKSYDDMRKFLEGKPQISLIPMRSANENFLNEDILE